MGRVVVFDTSALIALERRHSGILERVEILRRKNARIVIPSVVVAEWWRGGTNQAKVIIIGEVKAITKEHAQRAGEAISRATFEIDAKVTIDALVLAVAVALEDQVVYTSDFTDLPKFKRDFPTVKLLDWRKE